MDDRVHLRYGQTGTRRPPPRARAATLIGKRALPKLADAERGGARSARQPVAAPPYAELVRGRRSACILICDITRPVPNRLFLRPLIEGCSRPACRAERITVLVATGLHRPNEGEELAEVVGDPWVLADVQGREPLRARRRRARRLRPSPAGARTPVKLDRRFVEADLRIATGLVEPHFMAGYSGGRKVIAPGIAHDDTIRTFHSARFMEDPLAVQCNLDGNPLHEEQLEIVRMLGEVYALNTVIDDDRDLVHVNFGEVIASHLAAVDFVADSDPRRRSARRFRTIAHLRGRLSARQDLLPDGQGDGDAARHPRARRHADRRVGMLRRVRLARVPRRAGAACARSAPSLPRDAAAKQFADVDEWQTEMQLKSMRAGRVKLYTTGLDGEERTLTGVDTVDARSTRRSPTRSRQRGDPAVAVIPEGPYVVPVVA